MRKFIINVNGNSYEVEVEEVRNGVQQAAPAVAHVPTTAPTPAPAVPTPSPAPAPAPANKEVVISAGQEVIEAPMPGTILKINVSEGQSIKSGDVLLILEAMKMENEIISPVDGKVVGIATSVGASVNAGDKLVVIG
jgi:biotin carboxyl carrier protein